MSNEDDYDDDLWADLDEADEFLETEAAVLDLSDYSEEYIAQDHDDLPGMWEAADLTGGETDQEIMAAHEGETVGQVEEALHDDTAYDPAPDMGNPIMMGHCAHPQTKDPHLSHERCAKMGGGIKVKSTKKWHPCPCSCHHEEDEFECGECGGTIYRTTYWLGNSEPTYVHVDRTGRVTGEYCP